MLVLGLDTALQSCSVAVMNDGEVLAEQRTQLEKGHAEHLPPMARAALKVSGLTVRDLDRVGVVTGPGAFAGVRVGLAFARGLALGTKLDVVGVSSLAALAGAFLQKREGLTAAVIDARRGQVYAALYDAEQDVRVQPFLASPADATAWLAAEAGDINVQLTGGGVALLAAAPPNFTTRGAARDIDAKVVARLAAAMPLPDASPSPLYLRPPDATRAAPSPFEGLFQPDKST